jgi:hypothetical protein
MNPIDKMHEIFEDKIIVITMAMRSNDPRLTKLLAKYSDWTGGTHQDILDNTESSYSYCKNHENCQVGGYRCGNDGCYDGEVSGAYTNDFGKEIVEYYDSSKTPCSDCEGTCADCTVAYFQESIRAFVLLALGYETGINVHDHLGLAMQNLYK